MFVVVSAVAIISSGYFLYVNAIRFPYIEKLKSYLSEGRISYTVVDME